MGEAVEQRRGHLGVTEDAGPFTEAGGDQEAGMLVKPAEDLIDRRHQSNHEGVYRTRGYSKPVGDGDQPWSACLDVGQSNLSGPFWFSVQCISKELSLSLPRV
jgi:hypothetical protein